MTSESSVINKIVEKIQKASEEEPRLAALVDVIRAEFPAFQTHQVVDHIQVSNGVDPVLAIRTQAPGEFQTSQNSNVNGGVVVQIAGPPIWNARRLFDELGRLNGRMVRNGNVFA